MGGGGQGAGGWGVGGVGQTGLNASGGSKKEPRWKIGSVYTV